METKQQNKSLTIVTIVAMMFLYAMISFVTNLAAPVGKIWGASFEDPAQAERMGMLGNTRALLWRLFLLALSASVFNG